MHARSWASIAPCVNAAIESTCEEYYAYETGAVSPGESWLSEALAVFCLAGLGKQSSHSCSSDSSDTIRDTFLPAFHLLHAPGCLACSLCSPSPCLRARVRVVFLARSADALGFIPILLYPIAATGTHWQERRVSATSPVFA